MVQELINNIETGKQKKEEADERFQDAQGYNAENQLDEAKREAEKHKTQDRPSTNFFLPTLSTKKPIGITMIR